MNTGVREACAYLAVAPTSSIFAASRPFNPRSCPLRAGTAGTRSHAMPRHVWSLADELATLAHAVEAARRTADAASLSTNTASGCTATAEALAGSLALVAARLDDLGRVVRGELDPRRMWAPHNAVASDAETDAGDITFRAWGPKRRATEARRVLAQIEGELARRRR